jgi:hypothetical protein
MMHGHMNVKIILLPSGFPTKTLFALLFFPLHAARPTHLILHEFVTQTYLVRSIDARYSVTSNLLLFLPSYSPYHPQRPLLEHSRPVFFFILHRILTAIICTLFSLIYSCIQFLFVSIVPKYLKFVIFSRSC